MGALLLIVALVWLLGAMFITVARTLVGTPMTLPLTFIVALGWPWRALLKLDGFARVALLGVVGGLALLIGWAGVCWAADQLLPHLWPFWD